MDESKMNRDDIIRMAREAGLSSAVGKHIALDAELERFFQAAHAAGAAAEREACAKVADGYIGADPIATAIRHRSEIDSIVQNERSARGQQ